MLTQRAKPLLRGMRWSGRLHWQIAQKRDQVLLICVQLDGVVESVSSLVVPDRRVRPGLKKKRNDSGVARHGSMGECRESLS